jgi:diguanylate cyclase (GGDEF)-like protein
MMQYAVIALVSVGVVLLVYALKPMRELCREPDQAKGWKLLYALIVFFILGYALFVWHASTGPATLTEIVVSFILFGGSCFVVIVTRMSRLGIEHVKQIAALERRNALHDALTNLPNRTLLHQRLEAALDQARAGSRTMAVLLMDLDRFKEVNDTLGHHVGDRLLQQVAPRLRAAVRSHETVARLGGDEFAIVLPTADLQAATQLARRLLEAVEQPFRVEQHNLGIGLSIGICLYPEHATDSESLLRRADVAMYVAKRNASGYAVYDSKQDQYSLSRLKLLNALQGTIEAGGLVQYYQPYIGVTRRVPIVFEALARWDHPEYGLIPAVDFIPLAEQAGLVQSLTRWALSTAITNLAAWLGRGLDCQVSVNLSIKDLQSPALPDTVRALLDEHAVAADRLSLEITEGSVMTDQQRVVENIVRLNRLGVLILIDDFGTGYSSLSRLKQLPIGAIKIDRSFVLDMIEDEHDAIIVRSTIDLAHNMGKKVVAEGVENQDILDILEILRCDYAQGNFIAAPMPAADVPAWIDHQTAKGA